ncbi:methylenetetrahydrofolate reductase [NAD(P)H] [Neorhizobium sp. T786]|uniref:methylenetetrahydrofolate reductase [NAD(P)H] n=1 Tax=Pseudorhizobium xiangyangii TaxID=2883104 RepID=UPI001CFFF0F1|nr:methylenetetrahydrofolate reductase [NAD(P)H] [Neorhizobium xiangyangii]MCB5204988.1 methylenetetrahydrofolate reductase [NAD(P)H] [Neorhizobium xiangyangii]
MTPTNTPRKSFGISFEFFPPRSPDMEGQLWDAVIELGAWDPDFVSVTYGAGGSTKAPTLATVRRLLQETSLDTAAHLTCVDAPRDDVHGVVEEYRASGVKRIVALRGDPSSGIGTAYVPHPEGYADTAELVAGLKELGDFDISVSAYPEKHPESADLAADIEMLKRKADAGAARALSQFFFDNDVYERYMEKVSAAGVTIPVIPGIMPIQNLTQLKRFAGRCGSTVPAFLDKRFEGYEDKPEERAKVAADVAAEQMEDLLRRGVKDFHIYTMNRAGLVSGVLERLGRTREGQSQAGAAA